MTAKTLQDSTTTTGRAHKNLAVVETVAVIKRQGEHFASKNAHITNMPFSQRKKEKFALGKAHMRKQTRECVPGKGPTRHKGSRSDVLCTVKGSHEEGQADKGLHAL